MSFGWDSKRRWSLLSGVYARGSKRSHQSALECVTIVDSTSHSKPPEVRLGGWKSCPALIKEDEEEETFWISITRLSHLFSVFIFISFMMSVPTLLFQACAILPPLSQVRTTALISLWSVLQLVPLLPIITLYWWLHTSTSSAFSSHLFPVSYLAFRCCPCLCIICQYRPYHCSVYHPLQLHWHLSITQHSTGLLTISARFTHPMTYPNIHTFVLVHHCPPYQ